MKRVLLAVVATSVLVLAGCSSNASSSSSASGAAAESSGTASSAAASSPAAGSQTVLNAEQIANGQKLSDSAAGLTWFTEVSQQGECGKFSKTYAACEQKAWDLMDGYVKAEIELYEGFAATMAPGPCLDQINAMITDINAFGKVMLVIHDAAQKQDNKAIKAAAANMPTPTATDFAAACGVVAPSSSATPAPSDAGTPAPSVSTPSPAAS